MYPFVFPLEGYPGITVYLTESEIFVCDDNEPFSKWSGFKTIQDAMSAAHEYAETGEFPEVSHG